MALIRSGGWLAGLAVTAAVTTLASCKPRPEAAPAPVAEAPAAPAIPVPPPAVNRAELLGAVRTAADAFAAGRPMPKAVQELAGRRFSVRLPVGCLGPGADAAATYAYDADKGSLKLTARPQAWTMDEAVRGLVATPTTEDIEGFWIARPWISTDTCPAFRPQVIPETAPPAQGQASARAKSAKVAEPAPVTLPGSAPEAQTVGLVSVFEAGDSRLQRRGDRPYEVVRKVAAAPVGGFRLVLEGRIVQGPTGAVACRSDDPDRRPTCLVRVELDRVAIESAGGEMYGEWRS